MRKMQPSNELNPNIYAELNASQLTDDQILALSSVVYGFGLQDKLWGMYASSLQITQLTRYRRVCHLIIGRCSMG